MSISSSIESKRSFDSGDCIGTESFHETSTSFDVTQTFISPTSTVDDNHNNGFQILEISKQKYREKGFDDYPPVMPYHQFGLRKYTTGDGRVVIEQEKLYHRRYLHSERANGCLTLTLVDLLDSTDEDEEDCDELYHAEDHNVVDKDVSESFLDCSTNNVDDLATKFSELGGELAICNTQIGCAESSGSSSILNINVVDGREGIDCIYDSI